MSVKIKKGALQGFLKKTLFEMDQMQYGMYDRPALGDEAAREEEEEETTVPQEVPIQPAEMMANQLVDQRPPVEDEEFVPNNIEEFSRAVKALAGQVPSDQISKVYRDFQRIVNNSVGDSSTRELTAPEDLLGDTPRKEDVYEETLRRAVRLVLKEAGWSDDDDPRYRKGDGVDYSAMEDPPVDNEPDGANLDQIASEFGYAGASGARQDIERMLQRMKYIAEKMPKGAMEKLQDFAAQEFIDVMKTEEYLDDDEVVDLQQNTSEVKSLDSFRFFFVSGILLPAYQEVKRTARKKVEALIADMDVPKGAHQTIINQAFGETPRDADKLEQKILKVALADGVDDSDELDRMADKVRDGFGDIQKAAELEGNLLDLAMDRWGRQAKGRKAKALAQALGSTAEFQAEG